MELPIKELNDALLDAFRSYSQLQQMVRFQLDENLREIASDTNLSDAVFQLIEWAESGGHLTRLAEAALEAKPDNMKLKAIAAKMQCDQQLASSDARTVPPATGAHTPNPFVWRGPITEPDAFFNRIQEQEQLQDCLRKRQNCQIVGERRIGKTSLLLHVSRETPTWQSDAVVAWMDMHHPSCYTLSGFMNRTAKQFQWAQPPISLTELAEGVETMFQQGRRPILYIDGFEEFATRREEFHRDFFLTLRACSQQWMPIITSSRQPLSKLTDPGDPTSPFYNTFHVLALGAFTQEDAADFLTLSRPGVVPLTTDVKARLLEFARNHPLALQIAYYHIVEAQERSEPLSVILLRANDEMRALLPSW